GADDLDYRLDDQRDVGDAAAAGADGDRRARPEPLPEANPSQLSAHRGRDVGDALVGQVLADAHEVGQGQAGVVGHPAPSVPGPLAVEILSNISAIRSTKRSHRARYSLRYRDPRVAQPTGQPRAVTSAAPV